MYSQEVISRFEKFATASICDACDKVVGKRCFMDYEMKPRISGHKIVGPAITVLEGKSDVADAPSHAVDAIDSAQGGEVLVISLQEKDPNVCLWGGLMTAGAVVNGIVGAVLNCGVRDVTEIRRDFSQFEIYSRTVTPVTTVSRYTTLDSNVPVECCGVAVNPGDLIVGDIDGVICVPQDYVEQVMQVAEDIEAKEAMQTKYILETGSLKQGLALFNRI